MNTKAAEAVLVDNRIPARVVAAGPFWIDFAVLDDWEERIYSVRVSPSDLSDLVLDWRAACGQHRVCRLHRESGGLSVHARPRRAACE